MEFATGNPPQPSPKPARARKAGRIITAVVILLVLAGLAAAYLLGHRSMPPPAQMSSLAANETYKVFYPSKLPPGYSYTDGSAKIQSGLFYYKLHSGTKTITVTQQAVPASAVDLQKLPKYSSLNVPAGPAAIGVSVGNPSVVIATGTTLVSINSSKGVGKDAVVYTAQKMTEIKSSDTY